MKESVLALLRCPVCGPASWVLEANARNEIEVLAGRLGCRGCGRWFPIEGGKVDLVPPEALTDLQRLDREIDAQSDGSIAESKRRGEFVGELRAREDEYRRSTFERTEFLFREIEYDDPARRWVLDFGCGDPTLANRFAQAGFNVVALDYVPTRLDPALAYMRRDGTFFERVAGLMAKLPLADASMDIIFSHASLHHATPLRAEDFRWFDPANLLDSLREVRRVLKPDGLFLVSGEGEYGEEITDEQRHLEHKARESGCYEAFYKLSEYEWAFHQTGIFPHLWAQNFNNRLIVSTCLSGRFRRVVDHGDSVNRRANLLLAAPAIRADLDECLSDWARVRPWPAAPRVARTGGALALDDAGAFAAGWHPVEEAGEAGPCRWMGREAAALALELDYVPGPWALELKLRACSVLKEFRSAVFIVRDGRTIAKEIVPPPADANAIASAFEFAADFEPGPATVVCIPDGRMRVRVFFNGEPLETLEAPSDDEFHDYRIVLPAHLTRTFNQLTFEPSYALRPSDCTRSTDDRWLSCSIKDVRIERILEERPAFVF